MVSSLFQIFLGLTGLIGFLLRFIGPLTIAPTITLVGVALFRVAATHAGNKPMLPTLYHNTTQSKRYTEITLNHFESPRTP